jgi:hypothetical protein
VGPFPSWLVERLKTSAVAGRTGCAAHLREYRWGGGDWHRGLSYRREHATRLAEAATHEEFAEVARAILAWGGIRAPLDSKDIEGMRQTLMVLDRGR